MTTDVTAYDEPVTGIRTSAQNPNKKSRYLPPVNVRKMSLADALADTGRLPDSEQFSLLPKHDKLNGAEKTSLYCAGDVSLLRRPCVAIVGTRNLSEAGKRRTRRLARGLVDAGIVIVSGLAAGIDTVAHTTAIREGGCTIAVIGTPLDKAYPAENKKLQEKIYREYLLISQFAPGERTFRSSFPQRNKLMATISDATVVMEATDTSGTLHQAAECARLGRWLFIAKSVADDRSLTWPKKFLQNDTCVALEDVSDITSRVLR